MARGGDLKGSIVDNLQGVLRWSGTIGAEGRGVFDAEFAETIRRAESDEDESRKFKVESKTSEKSLSGRTGVSDRTRTAKGAARMRRTKVIGVVRSCARGGLGRGGGAGVKGRGVFNTEFTENAEGRRRKKRSEIWIGKHGRG
jgi:hypothetical protein